MDRPYLDPRVAAAKRAAHLALLDRWLPDLTGKTLLKTDLWEEGVAGDELLFSLAGRAGSVCAVDISRTVVEAAARRAQEAGVAPRLFCADVRKMPLPTGSVDVVLSTSTLDHLENAVDYRTALCEFRRVLTPGGVLVATIDNPQNIGHGLLRAAEALRLVPFPLGCTFRPAEFGRMLQDSGFGLEGSEYLVPAPRVLTTAAVRLARLLPARAGDRIVGRILDGLEALGQRAPARIAAFAAFRARARAER